MDFLDSITFNFQLDEFGDYVLLISLICLYLLPSMIAVVRGHINKLPIFITNLFLGTTGIGWVVSLAWSCTYQFDDDEPCCCCRRADGDVAHEIDYEMTPLTTEKKSIPVYHG